MGSSVRKGDEFLEVRCDDFVLTTNGRQKGKKKKKKYFVALDQKEKNKRKELKTKRKETEMGMDAQIGPIFYVQIRPLGLGVWLL
jgi:hypothetical protein